MRKAFVIMLGIVMLAPVCRAGEQPNLKDQKAKESYSLGYEFGNRLKAQGVDIDRDVLLSAVREALEDKGAALDTAEMRDILKQLRLKVIVQNNLRREGLIAKNREEGKTFLTANKATEGVTTLPSGLQYKVLREGNGPRPQATDEVRVNYRGTLVNGVEFDSSYGREEPATVKVNGAIKGWTEALQLMKSGAKWQLFVPAELAYGERQFNRIPPNSTLIFEVELLSIERSASRENKATPVTGEPAAKQLAAEANNPG